MSKRYNKNYKKTPPKEPENSPGKILMQARESCEISLQQIAGQLRLNAEIIEALESDDIASLPAPIFVRGYIRSYASIVGIDDERVLERYQALLGDTVNEASLATVRMQQNVVEKENLFKRYLPYVVISLLVLLGVILWMSSGEDAEPDQQQGQQSQQSTRQENAQAPLATPEPTPQAGGVLAPLPDIKPEKPTTVPAEEEVVVASTVEKPEQVEQKPAEKSPQTAEEKVEPATPDRQEEELVFRFENESWADVRDTNGKRLIFRMVKAGSQHTVRGVPPFKITLGNAHGVSLARDGRDVDLRPFIRGNVAKFRLGKVSR